MMPPQPPQDLATLVLPLLTLCQDAGAVICSHYHAPDAGVFEAKGDRDSTPLTAADLASDALIQRRLSALVEGLPVLSEESAATVASQRRHWERYWLVDPLDGTLEFLNRTDEFTINIALIEQHRPVLGVVYVPITQVAFVGIPGVLARRYQWIDQEWRSAELHCRALLPGEPLTLLASQRHQGESLRATLGWLGEQWGELQRKNSGSALKFCQMAAGEGDFYPRFSTCCEWDTAAGDAVVAAAGGAVLGLDGQPLRYNDSDSLYSPHFLALADPQHALWRRLLSAGPW